MSGIFQVPLTIPEDGEESPPLDTKGKIVCGYFMPDATTGTISLQHWNSIAKAFQDFIDLDGPAETYTPLSPDDTAGLKKIRVVSSSAEAAERKIVLVLR